MNFLQLCQKLHLIIGIGEAPRGTAPTTVLNQRGPEAEMVAWIKQSYEDIQKSRRRWLFRKGLGTLTLTVGVSNVTPSAAGIADFSAVLSSEADDRRPYLGVYLDTTADETPCYYIPYEEWVLGIYDRGLASAGNSRPSYFTQLPDGTLTFYPAPDQAYKVRVPYRKSLATLTNDSDTPILPEENHMMIVWWAVLKYYLTTREQTAEFRRNARENYNAEWHALTRDQLPEFTTPSY